MATPLLNESFNFANATLIFFVSFLSHFALDALPHWDYKMSSFPKENGERLFIFRKDFLIKDLFKNLLDGVIGLTGAFLIVGFPKDFLEFILFGLIVFGAILPDMLEALFVIKKWRFLESLHKFHFAVHGKKIFMDKPFWGIISQILIIVFIIFICRKLAILVL